MVNRKLAVQMREQGYGYATISQELGCSLDWCKKNLKDAHKPSKQEQNCLLQAVETSQSNSGITEEEIKGLVLEFVVDPDGLLFDAAMIRFKDKILSTKNSLIRPVWMKDTNSKQTLRDVLKCVEMIKKVLIGECAKFSLEHSVENSEQAMYDDVCKLLCDIEYTYKNALYEKLHVASDELFARNYRNNGQSMQDEGEYDDQITNCDSEYYAEKQTF
jgi:hypothetical protein